MSKRTGYKYYGLNKKSKKQFFILPKIGLLGKIAISLILIFTIKK